VGLSIAKRVSGSSASYWPSRVGSRAADMNISGMETFMMLSTLKLAATPSRVADLIQSKVETPSQPVLIDVEPTPEGNVDAFRLLENTLTMFQCELSRIGVGDPVMLMEYLNPFGTIVPSSVVPAQSTPSLKCQR
jgi:hypothetical protein